MGHQLNDLFFSVCANSVSILVFLIRFLLSSYYILRTVPVLVYNEE